MSFPAQRLALVERWGGEGGDGASKACESLRVEPVMGPAPLFALGDQVRLDENLHMMRECALAYGEMIEKLAGAQLPLPREGGDDFKAGLVRERAQDRHAGRPGCELTGSQALRKVVDPFLNGEHARLHRRVPLSRRVIESPVLSMFARQGGAADAATHGHHDIDCGDFAQRLAAKACGVDVACGEQAQRIGIWGVLGIGSRRERLDDVRSAQTRERLGYLASACVVRADERDAGSSCHGALLQDGWLSQIVSYTLTDIDLTDILINIDMKTRGADHGA